MNAIERDKENIKVTNRLLFEEDVIRAVDKHTNGDSQLDDDIKRVELFENEDVVLEQRGNRYYLSLYDKEGKFQREVTIDVKDDYNVELRNCK